METQNKKFTRLQTTLILMGVSILGFLTAYILSLVPSDLEAKALTILENQIEWQEYSEKRNQLMQELIKVEDAMDALHSETESLRSSINEEINF